MHTATQPGPASGTLPLLPPCPKFRLGVQRRGGAFAQGASDGVARSMLCRRRGCTVRLAHQWLQVQHVHGLASVTSAGSGRAPMPVGSEPPPNAACLWGRSLHQTPFGVMGWVAGHTGGVLPTCPSTEGPRQRPCVPHCPSMPCASSSPRRGRRGCSYLSRGHRQGRRLHHSRRTNHCKEIEPANCPREKWPSQLADVSD